MCDFTAKEVGTIFDLAKMVSSAVRFLAATVWLGSVLCSISIAVLETLVWLRTGEWHQWSVVEGMSRLDIQLPTTSWITIERAISAVGELPLMFAVPAVGFLFGILILFVAKMVDRAARSRK
jgi:hypothetical protein